MKNFEIEVQRTVNSTLQFRQIMKMRQLISHGTSQRRKVMIGLTTSTKSKIEISTLMLNSVLMKSMKFRLVIQTVAHGQVMNTKMKMFKKFLRSVRNEWLYRWD